LEVWWILGKRGFALKNLEDGRIENLIFKAWWDLEEEGKKLLQNFRGGKS